MNTILVQMSDDGWTRQAVHFAFALARNINGQVILLYMDFTPNPGLLGWTISPPTAEQHKQIEEYAAVARGYDVEFYVQPMQYVTLTEALVQISRALDACILFAHLPISGLGWWDKFCRWRLRHQLDNVHLYTLDESLSLRLETRKILKKILSEKITGQQI